MANFFVTVLPRINAVPLGETATFECIASSGVQVQEYSWIGSEKIALEERFSYSNDKSFLYVNNVKDYDNNTWVDCTVGVVDGRQMRGSGRLMVLPSSEGWEPMVPNGKGNETMMETLGEGYIPPLTAAGGVVIALGFILVIIAMFGILRWLKKMEIRKEQDKQTARNRYSAIEIGPSARARYNRDQGNVKLGGEYAYGGGDEEEGENDDSYEDMLPAMPKMRQPKPDTSPVSPLTSGPRGPPRGGGPRYQPPPKY